ncbi:2'-5' RNA ligase family protein [Candidatus Pacearchaeota archaeon]|nr:2'-5' RNA ligase family protein [Candidatus Pacearchaeota archaeon]
MNYTIAIFPEFNEMDKINSIRKKYDPLYNWLKPHIALVYYFKEKPTTEKINKIIGRFPSFKIKLNKINTSSKGNLIFLEVTKGQKKIIEIKNALYKGLGLKWDKDFSYKPHMTIANLRTKEGEQNALKEIKNKNLNFSCKIDSFYVLEISEDLKRIQSKRKFNLS